VFARNIDNIEVEVNETGITDHRSLITTASLHTENPSQSKIPLPKSNSKIVSYLDRKKFQALLSKEAWTEIDFTDVDTAFESFVRIYNNLKNNSTITREIKNAAQQKTKDRKRASWLSNDAHHLIFWKKELYKQMKKRKKRDHEYEVLRKEFKSVSAELVKRTRQDKIKYYSKRLGKCEKPKDFWKEIKRICKRDKKENKQEIRIKDVVNNKEITDPHEVAHTLNAHFSAIAQNEIERNPLFDCNTRIKYSTNQEKVSLNSFACFEITMFDLHRAIKKLTNKFSDTDDRIQASELKQYWEQLGIPILLIFNFSLQKGVFPKILKKLTIVPVPKIPHAAKLEDFRPISILSPLSKLFEKLIQERMVKFLQKQNYFSSKQFGFLPGRNTSEAVQSHIFEITNNLENHEKTIGLYIDISKAFDTVNHEILLDKLYKAGFRGEFHKWLSSYLKDRIQCVKYKQIRSTLLPVVSGVPQGSTLGPVLFLIYVNSLLTLSLRGPVFSFADDTAIVYGGKTISETIEKCESDLLQLNDWFRHHKICPNLMKTKIIHFAYKKTNDQPPNLLWHLPNCNQLSCNCLSIEAIPQVKYLGIILNSNLNWEGHALYQQKKLRKLNYLMYYLRNTVPKNIRLKIYKSLYEPTLHYGVECWGGAANYLLHPIKVLQKYAVRSIASVGRIEHTKPLFEKMRLLPFEKLYKRALISVIHRKAKIGELPAHTPHTYHTRKREKYKIPKWLGKKARRQVNFQVPHAASKIPDHLAVKIGTPCFLTQLKNYLFEEFKNGK
jgi:hypothetical protein